MMLIINSGLMKGKECWICSQAVAVICGERGLMSSCRTLCAEVS